MKTLYRTFKLWIWWNFSIEKNEFHRNLDLFRVYYKTNVPLCDTSRIVVARRQIAHELDNDDSYQRMKEISKLAYYNDSLL